MKTRAMLILSLVISIGGLAIFITGVPFVWQAVRHRWKPSIEASVVDLIGLAVLLFAPIATVLFLRRHTDERRKTIGMWAERIAITSLACLCFSLTALVVLHYLPLRQTGENIYWILPAENKKPVPNVPQPNHEQP
jgi:divalent metal cation (Fe/Co/Zn/Cd) transporter